MYPSPNLLRWLSCSPVPMCACVCCDSQTELQSVAVGESFTVRLGADPRVSVRYKPAQVQRDSQARSMLVTHKQLIELHNLHGKAIHVTLYEPIPLPLPADDSKIKVPESFPLLPLLLLSSMRHIRFSLVEYSYS